MTIGIINPPRDFWIFQRFSPPRINNGPRPVIAGLRCPGKQTLSIDRSGIRRDNLSLRPHGLSAQLLLMRMVCLSIVASPSSLV